jgi:hypothetical protein
MRQPEMLKEMCRAELSQADFKAIGHSRGFDAQTIGSRALMQHVFLSEQGVRAALASLAESEILGLHLLNCWGDEVELEFFKRLYADTIRSDIYATYTERFKGLFQQVKIQLIRRGILLFGTLPEGILCKSVLERRRFRFPEEFAPWLPTPFRTRAPGGQSGESFPEYLARETRRDFTPARRAWGAVAEPGGPLAGGRWGPAIRRETLPGGEVKGLASGAARSRRSLRQ